MGWSWRFNLTSFLHVVILSFSLWALHLNKHASFLLCDRLLLMKNDQTVSLYHPAISANSEQSRAINLTKRAFLSSNSAKSLGGDPIVSFEAEDTDDKELPKFSVVENVTISLWAKPSVSHPEFNFKKLQGGKLWKDSWKIIKFIWNVVTVNAPRGVSVDD